MQSLAQFKETIGIEKIELMQGKGRKFANLPDDSQLFVGQKTVVDGSQPLFVIVNDGSTNKALEGSLWLVNSTVKVTDMI